MAKLFKKDREDFESKWSDLGVFVKYGMISEEKFYDKAQKFALLETVDGEFSTIEEYKEKIKANQTDKHGKIIMIYTNNPTEHDSFIQAAKNRNYQILKFDTVIDNHFMQQLEQKLGDVTFVRVDSDIVDNLVQTDDVKESVLSDKQQEKIKELFTTEVGTTGGNVETKAMSPEDLPVVITRPEFMRRMMEMQKMQGMDTGAFPEHYNVIVNTNHDLIANKLVGMKKAEKKTAFVKHLYNLALLNQGMLKGADLTKFINSSIDFLK